MNTRKRNRGSEPPGAKYHGGNTRTHPNRSKQRRNDLSRIPSPDEIKAAREKAGLTQEQAAKAVHSKLRSWQQWEADAGTSTHRRMHPAFFDLFTRVASDETALEALREIA